MWEGRLEIFSFFILFFGPGTTAGAHTDFFVGISYVGEILKGKYISRSLSLGFQINKNSICMPLKDLKKSYNF